MKRRLPVRILVIALVVMPALGCRPVVDIRTAQPWLDTKVGVAERDVGGTWYGPDYLSPFQGYVCNKLVLEQKGAKLTGTFTPVFQKVRLTRRLRQDETLRMDTEMAYTPTEGDDPFLSSRAGPDVDRVYTLMGAVDSNTITLVARHGRTVEFTFTLTYSPDTGHLEGKQCDGYCPELDCRDCISVTLFRSDTAEAD